MRTRAKMKYVASDRARRENVPLAHSLFSLKSIFTQNSANFTVKFVDFYMNICYASAVLKEMANYV